MAKKVIRRTRKQVYELWIEALRSGKYKQARNTIKRGDSFCCLGVLCDLSRKDGGAGFNEHHLPDIDRHLDVHLNELGMYTLTIAHLVRMNDQLGKSFEEIADHIESVVMPAALSEVAA